MSGKSDTQRIMVNIVIIDNYDSFTYNLYQYVRNIAGGWVKVFKNDEISNVDELFHQDIDAFIISPGPGNPGVPSDVGISQELLLKCRKPVLGVCLGHQAIAHFSGGQVTKAPFPVHGRLSKVFHNGSGLYEGIPSPFSAVRYHSLVVAPGLPEALNCEAWSEDGLVMGLSDASRPVWGIQFHPESICTEHGHRLVANFLRQAYDHKSRHENGRNSMEPTRDFAQTVPQPDGVGVPAERSSEDTASARPYHLHAEELDLWVDPEAAYLRLHAARDDAFWLDSARVEAGLSRFSFMGDGGGPLSERLLYDRTTGTLSIRRAGGEDRRRVSVFDYLARRMAHGVVGDDKVPFPFAGGFVGYFGYELKSECGAGVGFGHAPPTPDAGWIFADRFIAFDHERQRLWLVALGESGDDDRPAAWIAEMAKVLRAMAGKKASLGDARDMASTEPAVSPVRFTPRHGRDAYLDLIETCQREIWDGESYEICLTNMIRTPTRPDPVGLYRVLRRLNPAPYAGLLRFGPISILSSSPERFLKMDAAGRIEAKPIKGTIRRGKDQAEDNALRDRLSGSEKDRAENLMIVHLLRNDLGKVSQPGSVHVPHLMAIESYQTVHQMVSTIRGTLREDFGMIDLVMAAFPGGSMTGAPKVRTMNIIDELEAGARGVYSGALGYLSLGGALDLNIVIRTVVVDEAGTSIGCGGAITALSTPHDEHVEMMLKAEAPMRAIALWATGDEEQFLVEESASCSAGAAPGADAGADATHAPAVPKVSIGGANQSIPVK